MSIAIGQRLPNCAIPATSQLTFTVPNRSGELMVFP